MKIIKEFFNLKTKDASFKKTILQNAVVWIILIMLACLSLLVPNKELMSIFLIAIAAIFLYFFWFFLLKMLVISDNKKLAKERKNRYSPKYRSINVYTTDLEIWLNNAKETETIHIKSNEKIFHTITVEVIDEGVRYYYLDERKFDSVDGLWKTLNFLPVIDNNKIVVCECTKGDPKEFVKVIQDLKK